MNLLSFSPCSLMPMPNKTPVTRKVRNNLIQKVPLPNCEASDFFASTFSHQCHVPNFKAEKSNQPAKTDTQAIAMTMNPIHTANQSSFFNKSDFAIILNL